MSSLVRADLSAGHAGEDFSPTATRVVFLFMAGGPSQVDTLDPKPDLEQLSGRDVPESIARTDPAIKRAGLKNLLAAPWAFHRCGESGIEISELFPETSKHGDIKRNHSRMAPITDRPVAALLTDLKQRSLLDSTLVVWGGEFGRTPTMEGRAGGRDHSPAGYRVWMAGGGIRGGQVIGQTDPIGYVVTERPVSPHDFHATILHALGLEASRLTYNHHGRAEVPTVFGGAVVHGVCVRFTQPAA